MGYLRYDGVYMYDDYDEEYEDEGEIGLDQETIASKKGSDDRAFVDQQAKEYDEMKKHKRDELAALKQQHLALQSKLGAKERELHVIERDLRTSQYVDTRKSIAEERNEAEGREISREEKANTEIDIIGRENDRAALEAAYAMLHAEVVQLRASADETARKISLLEHEILRS